MARKKLKLKIEDVQDIENVDEVLQRKISAFGNAAHMILPQKHIDKDGVAIVLKNRPNQKEITKKELKKRKKQFKDEFKD